MAAVVAVISVEVAAAVVLAVADFLVVGVPLVFLGQPAQEDSQVAAVQQLRHGLDLVANVKVSEVALLHNQAAVLTAAELV
jgi:hypothetical protein